jgi:FkbM family methyltransferase
MIGHAAGLDGHGQFGEDRLLAMIFTRDEGCCLEVGAYDGITGSPTLAFERKGWTAILVEPLPDLAERASLSRKGPVICAAAGPSEGVVVIQRCREDAAISSCAVGNSFQSEMNRIRAATFEPVEVPQVTLDSVLEACGVVHLDFASIDVEGTEAEVLRGFDLNRWGPRVVLLEDNSRGADRSVLRIMASLGYRRFRTTGVNDWCACQDDHELVNWKTSLAETCREIWVWFRSLLKILVPSALKAPLRSFESWLEALVAKR